eukprot:scpid71461/ scgid29915/ 
MASESNWTNSLNDAEQAAVSLFRKQHKHEDYDPFDDLDCANDVCGRLHIMFSELRDDVEKGGCTAEETNPEKCKQDLALAMQMIALSCKKIQAEQNQQKAEMREFHLDLCLALLRNSHYLLSKEMKETYAVDFHFDREESVGENPPLNHACRSSFNKRIVEWLVQDCGQDVQEVYEGHSCLGYAVDMCAGDMPVWFLKHYPQSAKATSIAKEVESNDRLKKLIEDNNTAS